MSLPARMFRSPFFVAVVAVGIVFAVPVLGAEVAVQQTSLERAPEPPGPSLVRQDPESLQELRSQEVSEGLTNPMRIVLSSEELEAEPQPGERRVRVGHTKSLGAEIEFSGLRPRDLSANARTLRHGAIRGTGDGGFVWTAVVESSGASALRLRFVSFFLPRDATLYLYSDSGEVVGPYSGRGPNGDGQFWSHTLRGSEVRLQLRYEGRDTARVLRATRFVIADVGHLTNAFLLSLFSPSGVEAAGSNLCGFNASCVQNAFCTNIPAAIQEAQDAVALILFVSGAFQYICSGGLLNDTDATSFTPFFLTAHHCVSKDQEAASVQAFFQFITTDCGVSCAVGAIPSTLGASIVAKGRSTDFTLLELAEQAPGGSAFLGWTTDNVASVDGTALFRISHPQGAPR